MANPTTGEIPAHWEYTTLGEICDRGGGNIQTGPFGSQLHASDYVPVGVPSIMPVNIGDNRLNERDIKRITEEDAVRLSKHRVIPGDIIYSRRGDVERRAMVREEQNGWLCGTGCMKVRLGNGVVDPAFASFYLGHPQVREWIVQHAVGATMPNLNTSIMRSIPFARPPMDEQRAIASILGSLDDKIELNRRMNETLEGIARALFKSWFVDFDPVRAKMDGRQPAGMAPEIADLFPASFEHVSETLIPTTWKLGPILEIASLLSGGTPKTSVAEYWDGSIPWASAKDVSQCGDAFLIRTERAITQAGLEKSATKLIEPYSTVVVARGATTGRLAMFGHAIAMNQTCYALHSKHDLHLFLYCHARHFIAELVHSAHGSVFDTITTSTFQTTPVLLPDVRVALAFDEAVTPLFLRIRENLYESNSVATLRDTLLPKLLSGELRVPEADKMVEEVL